MIDNLFRSLFDTDMTVVITPAEFLTCLGVSLGIGLILAALYQYHTRYTRSFVVTLALLPAVVCVVIMKVNGNVGTGVAVAGTFSLVRFRSAPGTAREICAIFLAMAAGLIAGMGYLGYAVLCTLVLGGAELLFRMLSAKADGGASLYKTLHITIPEDLDYSDVFDEPLREFTREYELTSVKTTNMGSLFRLTYNITLRDSRTEKSLIDRLRCRFRGYRRLHRCPHR